jgi:hypothetical protein
MCDPVTMAVVGGASAGMQALGARQQAQMQFQAAKQQAEMQRRYQAQSIAAAQRKAGFQRTAAVLERQQQQETIRQEKGRVAKAGEAITSKAVVAAGEAGVSGLSVQALMDDYIRQQAGQVAALTSQDKLYALRHGLNLEQLGLASQQEIMGLSRPILDPIKDEPSVLGMGLDILQGGMKGYSMGRSFQNTLRPAYIDTGMGTSSYMPDTDQYTLPARGPLAIGRR